MAKSRTRRNVILIVVLFVLVGVAVFFARSMRPTAVIGPEPAEIRQARLSKTQNGYFVLRAAQKGLKPVVVRNVVREPEFELGPMARLLDVPVREDAPEIGEAIEGAGPLVEAVREALSMPYVLRPIDWDNFEAYSEQAENPYEILGIFPRLFLVGIEEAKRGNVEEAVGIIQDYYALAWRFIDEVGVPYTTAGTLLDGASLVRTCPAEFQDGLKEALEELRRNWQPPKFKPDTQLRVMSAQAQSLPLRFLPIAMLLGPFRRDMRARRVIAENLETVREVSKYDYKGYEKWAANHRDLAEACEAPMLGFFSLKSICRNNSLYVGCLDGMCALIAVEQYKRERGAYPESLSELVPAYLPEVPQDPRCEGPLTYRRDGDDYFLYMLGSGCKDLGGQRYHSNEILIHVPEDS